jgi:hypothetical protein
MGWIRSGEWIHVICNFLYCSAAGSFWCGEILFLMVMVIDRQWGDSSYEYIEL